MSVAAYWVECKDAEHVGQVADTSEQEEQGIQPIRAFAPVVQKQLGQAATEVEYSAEIAKCLSGRVELKNFILFLRSFATCIRRGWGKVVSSYSRSHYYNDGCQVEQDLLI